MKFIKKKEREPQRFTDWKALSNEEWQPAYHELSGRVKKDVVDSLLDEQGSLCCYCGQQISASTSHVEHFRPQSRFPEKELEYVNLHVSCQKVRKKQMPEYCGIAKGDWFDEELTISPLGS